MDPPRPPQRLLDEVERARQSALGRYSGSLSRRMPTSPAWRGMPSYRPPAGNPDAYAAGVAWGSAAAYGDLAVASPPGDAAPPLAAAAPPDEEEDDDDDFYWSDHGEEGGGPQMQEAI